MKEYARVLIFGYGTSGKAVEEVLCDKKISYNIYDKDKNKVDKKLYIFPNKKNILYFDTIVLSPAIDADTKILRYARKKNRTVMSELEFGFQLLKSSTKLISITGTNGKTTITSMLCHTIANLTKNKVAAVGNIGNPLSAVWREAFDYLVCEVSSFQLQAIDAYTSDISVFVNLFEDHIDRHSTYENYVLSKLNLFKNNTKKSKVILNADDEEVMKNCKNVVGQKYYISKQQKVKGVYLSKKFRVMSNLNGKSVDMFDIRKLHFPSIFYDNILCVVLCILLLNINTDKILQVLDKYEIMSHRYEIVSSINDVLYIDDSKATNTHSVIHSVKNTNCDVNLLIGGINKNLKFEKLFEQRDANVANYITFGASGKQILKIGKKYALKNIYYFPTLKEAIIFARDVAMPGSAVLLSPGCASFDEFLNYAERGNFFKNIVYKMEAEYENKNNE